mgnify:CR=1 FL=1
MYRPTKHRPGARGIALRKVWKTFRHLRVSRDKTEIFQYIIFLSDHTSTELTPLLAMVILLQHISRNCRQLSIRKLRTRHKFLRREHPRYHGFITNADMK